MLLRVRFRSHRLASKRKHQQLRCGAQRSMHSSKAVLMRGRAQPGSPRVHGTARASAFAYVTIVDGAPRAAARGLAATRISAENSGRHNLSPPAQRGDGNTSLARSRSMLSADVRKDSATTVDDRAGGKETSRGGREFVSGMTLPRRSLSAVVQVAADATAAAVATAARLPGDVVPTPGTVRSWPVQEEGSIQTAPAPSSVARAKMVIRSGSLRSTSTPSTAQVCAASIHTRSKGAGQV